MSVPKPNLQEYHGRRWIMTGAFGTLRHASLSDETRTLIHKLQLRMNDENKQQYEKSKLKK